MLSLIIITSLALGAPQPAGAGASSRPALKVEPVKLEVAEVWSLCTKAYAQAVHERLLITVRHEKQTRASELIFRADPGKAVDRSDAQVLVELSPLRVHIAGNVLTAISTTHEGTFAEQKLTPPMTSLAMEPLIPALPLVQLCAVASLKSDQPMPIATYVPDITWKSASVMLDDANATIIMLGQGKHASARLAIDQRTGRMRSLTLELASPSAMTIEIAITPVEPTDPAAWKLETTKRAKVNSLSQLVRRPEPAPEPAAPAENKPSSDAKPDPKPAPESPPPSPPPAPADKPKR